MLDVAFGMHYIEEKGLVHRVSSKLIMFSVNIPNWKSIPLCVRACICKPPAASCGTIDIHTEVCPILIINITWYTVNLEIFIVKIFL